MQLALKIIGLIFVTSAVLSVVVVYAGDAEHFPQAGFLLQRFEEIMLLCAGAVAGLLPRILAKRHVP